MDVTIGLATGDDDTVTDCAQLWADAVARRDDTEPQELRHALGGLRGRLRMRGADLIVAQHRETLLGFAVLVADQADATAAELYYLATNPDHWGEGVGARLLAAVEAYARATRRVTLRLWVIDDNERAARLYEGHGWVATADTQVDAGRVERRYLKAL